VSFCSHLPTPTSSVLCANLLFSCVSITTKPSIHLFAAYFELQVGYMTNLADNLSDRINYLPTSIYLTQTFFNKTSGHPVLDKTVIITCILLAAVLTLVLLTWFLNGK